MKIKNYARKYIVHRFQYRLLVNTLVYIAAVVLVFTGVLFVPLMIVLDSDARSSPVVQDAAHEFITLHTRLWPAVFVLVALLVTHTIIFSHRIAGPLERIRGELKKIGDGNLAVHVRIRKNDYLHEQVGSVNEMVEALREKIRTIEQNQKNANAVLSNLQRALIRGSGDEMNDQIEELGVVLERLKVSVGEFEFPRDAACDSKASPPSGNAKAPKALLDVEAPTSV